MIRKVAIALAAIATLGATGLATSSDAVAGPKKGWHKGGIHFGFGHGWRHRHWGPRFGFYAPGYDYDCYKVRTKRGTRIVCSY